MKILSIIGKNGYLAWNPNKYAYYKKNFYIGLSFYENPKYTETGYASTSIYTTDNSIEYSGLERIYTEDYEEYFAQMQQEYNTSLSL